MKIISSLILVLFCHQLFAQAGTTVIAVGEAELESEKILIEEPFFDGAVSPHFKAGAQEVISILRNDFSFYKKKFYSISPITLASSLSTTPDFEVLNKKAIKYYLKSEVVASSGTPNLYVAFYDVSSKHKIFEGPLALTLSQMRENAHILADSLYYSIFKKHSIFIHKVIFVSDRTSIANNKKKEAYIMDFDGKGVRQLTKHGGTVISPDISYDSSHLIYSMIPEGKRARNVDLYLMDLKSFEYKIVSSRKGINSGAVFLPDGQHVLLTLSYTGNAEIYKLELGSGKLTQITHHFAADVDPALNKDGTLMTFLSDRPGKANIYTLDPRGVGVEKDIKRISFVGLFNATPRFSPDGKEIVFSSWLDNRFDIFRINSDGSGLSRLTKDFGSNEDPSYSPDGEFIVFSSQRILSSKSAIQDIYIMDKDGEILGPLTHNFGNCTTPRWTK